MANRLENLIELLIEREILFPDDEYFLNNGKQPPCEHKGWNPYTRKCPDCEEDMTGQMLTGNETVTRSYRKDN